MILVVGFVFKCSFLLEEVWYIVWFPFMGVVSFPWGFLGFFIRGFCFMGCSGIVSLRLWIGLGSAGYGILILRGQ